MTPLVMKGAYPCIEYDKAWHRQLLSSAIIKGIGIFPYETRGCIKENHGRSCTMDIPRQGESRNCRHLPVEKAEAHETTD